LQAFGQLEGGLHYYLIEHSQKAAQAVLGYLRAVQSYPAFNARTRNAKAHPPVAPMTKTVGFVLVGEDILMSVESDTTIMKLEEMICLLLRPQEWLY